MALTKKVIVPRKRDPSLIMFLALNMILLAFFILMVALSAPDKTKEAELAIEVRKAFQSFGGSFLGMGDTVQDVGLSRDEHAVTDTQKVEAMVGELTHFIEENKEAKAISLELTEEGLKIHISEAFSFQKGAAEMQDKGLPLYNKIHDLILRTTNKVRIEGHTDNAEVDIGQILDTWELSARRAMSVFRFFTGSGEVSGSRFKVIGYGSQKPLVSNLTEAGRRSNRRVTIVFEGRLTKRGD